MDQPNTIVKGKNTSALLLGCFRCNLGQALRSIQNSIWNKLVLLWLVTRREPDKLTNTNSPGIKLEWLARIKFQGHLPFL